MKFIPIHICYAQSDLIINDIIINVVIKNV